MVLYPAHAPGNVPVQRGYWAAGSGRRSYDSQVGPELGLPPAFSRNGRGGCCSWPTGRRDLRRFDAVALLCGKRLGTPLASRSPKAHMNFYSGLRGISPTVTALGHPHEEASSAGRDAALSRARASMTDLRQENLAYQQLLLIGQVWSCHLCVPRLRGWLKRPFFVFLRPTRDFPGPPPPPLRPYCQ